MARTVKTWNPAFVNDNRSVGESPFPAFRTITIADSHEHNANDMTECRDCGAFLCEICGSDQHSTSDGHDLSNPRYWGV